MDAIQEADDGMIYITDDCVDCACPASDACKQGAIVVKEIEEIIADMRDIYGNSR